jgi:hypothetical protein
MQLINILTIGLALQAMKPLFFASIYPQTKKTLTKITIKNRKV